MRQFFCAFAAAATLLATPAAAQNATPQQNLDCAIWAASQAASAEDTGAQAAFGFGLGWFVGLYEAQTGKAIDAAFLARSEELDEAGIAALTDTCAGRLLAMSERLANLGNSMDGGEY